jgi:hypothetical protein
MAEHRISETNVELWADDPNYFFIIFLRGLLQRSRHVKIPHCFNLEDVSVPNLKNRLETIWRNASWAKRMLFLPWQRLTTGIDMRMQRVVYDRAYTFDEPSPWAENSIDLSYLISGEAFESTYQARPLSLRQEIEALLASIVSRRPLVLLLLFELEPEQRLAYQGSVLRLFSEHSAEFRNCAFAVKMHPGSYGPEEKHFIHWLKSNLPAEIFPITNALNLEFIISRLKPDYVWAGPCGALPIVKRLDIGRAIVIQEILEEMSRAAFPEEREAYLTLTQDLEIW